MSDHCFLSGPPESSILTYRAKEQIAHLVSMDSEEWDADTINQYFPISYTGASKHLNKLGKNPNRFLRNLDGIIRHDTRCITNLILVVQTIVSAHVNDLATLNVSQTLEALSTLLPANLRWIGLQDALQNIYFADGNDALPYPVINTLEAYKLTASRHQAGPFQQMAEKLHPPVDPDDGLRSVREEQLAVIRKMVALFKSQDFAVLIEPLKKNDSLTFKEVFRDWLIRDQNTPQLEAPSVIKPFSKVDCDFTQFFRYKRVCT